MRFTVLTPTYNRAHLIGRVYSGLCDQSFRDFEWVVVDDGSTDGTRDLVLSWEAPFPLRYVSQANHGKHTAVNLGVRMAAGEFVVIADSDDELLPNALERFDYHWRRIPNSDRFAFVVGLCYKADGKTILGSNLDADHVDVFTPGANMKLCDADRWGMCRTDILRRFPYPVFENERFVVEGVVWNRILRKYASRFVNEPLKIVHYESDGLSSRGDLRFTNPRGAVVYHSELAVSSGVPLLTRLKAALNAVRFSLVAIARELGFLR